MGDKEPPDLDSTDLDMVDLLRANGRMSVNSIAQHVGVSRANAYRRLDRLLSEGVITGFTASVNPALVGRPLAVVLLVNAQQRMWRSVREALAALSGDGLEFLAITAGTPDFVALIRAPDMATLRGIVLGKVHAIPGVVSTQTICVLEEVEVS